MKGNNLKGTGFALVLALCLIFLATPIRVCAAAQGCADKILSTCTSCHNQARICEKLGKKSRRDWTVTIKRMLRYGLVLGDADQKSMLECLMALKTDRAKLCE